MKVLASPVRAHVGPAETPNLVKRLKQRSSDAFEELVDACAGPLFSVGMRFLGNRQDVEDALQETFLKAFLSISAFQARCSIYTWLYRIMVNECVSKIRRQKEKVVPIEDFLPRFENGRHAEEIFDWSRPDRAFATEELIDVVEGFIRELPPSYRIPYILRDVEGLSENEVCETLDVPKGVVRNRVHQARLVIRRRVENHFRATSRTPVVTDNHPLHFASL